jgi:BirA family biotin operon repressor/biotin-[acetyl-CoA-carboxylase] ligase
MPGNLVSATLRGGLFTRVVGNRLLFFQEIGSTMDEAAREAEAGAEEGTVVLAESQTAGRGRMGRDWVSRGGNLYLSVVFRPSLRALPLLGILAGVAVTRAIRKTTGLDPGIKWPNDVLVDGKKVAGILAESVVTGNVVSHAVVGIGINVGLDTEAIEDIAGFSTALNAAAGRPILREDVLRQLLHDLDALYLQVGRGGSPMAEWRASLGTLGQRVWAHWRGDSCVGLAEDVDELGNLQLRLDDGRLITLSAGDVTLQGHAPSLAEEARTGEDGG